MRARWYLITYQTKISALSKQDCQNELLNNIDLNIGIVVERPLKHPPFFTTKNINLHRLSSGKIKNFVLTKKLERVRKFENGDCEDLKPRAEIQYLQNLQKILPVVEVNAVPV